MQNVLWVDSHCHPQYDSLGLTAIQHAFDNSIARLCCVGIDLTQHEFLISCKKKFNVAISIGEHPTNDFSQVNWDLLEQLLPYYNAVGETGFDFQTEVGPQIEAFERQAYFAQKFNLPVILHIRDSGDGAIESLAMQEISKFPNLKGVFHCFVGSKKLADFAISRGFFVSFSGIITFKKCDALRTTMKIIPMDLFLIETDAPYLAPEPYRGKPNFPVYARHIGEFIAHFLNLDLLQFSNYLMKNFDALYPLSSL